MSIQTTTRAIVWSMAVSFSLTVPHADAAVGDWLKRKAAQTGNVVKKGIQAIPGNKQEPTVETEEAAPDSVAADAASAAILCGGVAAATGGSKENIAISGAACGAINGTITMLGNRGKKKYAQDYKRISEEMAETQTQINSLEAQEATNLASASNLERDVGRLIQNEKNDKQFISEAKVLRKEMDQQMRDVKQSSATADAKIQIVDQQIADLDEIIKASPDLEDLQNTRTALVAQRGKLVENVKSANSMNENLIAQKSRLDDEIIERS